MLVLVDRVKKWLGLSQPWCVKKSWKSSWNRETGIFLFNSITIHLGKLTKPNNLLAKIWDPGKITINDREQKLIPPCVDWAEETPNWGHISVSSVIMAECWHQAYRPNCHRCRRPGRSQLTEGGCSCQHQIFTPKNSLHQIFSPKNCSQDAFQGYLLAPYAELCIKWYFIKPASVQYSHSCSFGKIAGITSFHMDLMTKLGCVKQPL